MGGGQGEGANLFFGQNVPKNCMKTKEIGSGGGGGGGGGVAAIPLDLPMFFYFFFVLSKWKILSWRSLMLCCISLHVLILKST